MIINRIIYSTLTICGLFFAHVVTADTYGFAGQIDTVTIDSGESLFSGAVAGDDIQGGMSYDTAFGIIFNFGPSSITYNVECCFSAGGVETLDSVVLDEATAELYNQLLMTTQFSGGDIVDILHAEGGATTPSDTRVELGVTFVLFENAFNSGDAYIFKEEDLRLSIAFVLEDSLGVDIFSAYGVVVKNSDGDNVPDNIDNCTFVTNSNQRDTDGDGIGNKCDADIDNSCFVNFLDFAYYPPAFLSQTGGPTFNENIDFDGDGVIGFIDLAFFQSLFFTPPGPSFVDCVAGSGEIYDKHVTRSAFR